MNWISSLCSRIARLPEQETRQFATTMGTLCGLAVLLALVMVPVMSALGAANTIWGLIVTIGVLLAALVVVLWVLYQLLKRGYSNLRG